jgi:histone-lysine N-methyltransferase SETD3
MLAPASRASCLHQNADRAKFEAGDGGAEDPDYPRKIQVFEEWLLHHGARFPKLTMQKYDDEVRGVHATGEIVPDEIIVEVPLACLITVEMGKATEVGRAVLQADLELDAPKHVFLMLFMLVDRKKPASHFKPYYDILPPTLSNMPIFWNNEELALLEGSYLLTQIDERNAAIETDYQAICELYPGFSDTATLDDFKWARMCVCSRNFGIVVDGIRTSAMVPYADMLNHYRPRETKWTYEASRRAFTITSLMHIGPGAQVYDSYGQKCNHRFLLNYGFAIEKNREADGFCPNEVPFKFSLDPSDELYDMKLPLWRNDGHLNKLVRVCVSDNDNTSLAFACLRIIVANREEINLLGNSAS